MSRGDRARQLLGLAGWWFLRVVIGYLVLTFGLLAFGLLGLGLVSGPGVSLDRVGGLAVVVVGYLFWTAVLVPAFAVIGLVQGTVVWAAARWSGGSARVCALAGGASATALSVIFVLVTSDPRPLDLVGYVGASVLVGLLAGWLSARDCARLVRRQIPVDTAPVVR